MEMCGKVHAVRQHLRYGKDLLIPLKGMIRTAVFQLSDTSDKLYISRSAITLSLRLPLQSRRMHSLGACCWTLTGLGSHTFAAASRQSSAVVPASQLRLQRTH